MLANIFFCFISSVPLVAMLIVELFWVSLAECPGGTSTPCGGHGSCEVPRIRIISIRFLLSEASFA